MAVVVRFSSGVEVLRVQERDFEESSGRTAPRKETWRLSEGWQKIIRIKM